jgi:hypothetical protein
MMLLSTAFPVYWQRGADSGPGTRGVVAALSSEIVRA